jgi:FMN phosphatase YigB (HAD superfamily)
MLKAVLLDLDNTMVLFSEPQFYQRYFKRIGPFFADLFNPKAFIERMIRATRGLKDNNGQKLNVDHFLDFLTAGNVPAQREQVWQRFIQFYTQEYDRIERQVSAPEGLGKTLDFLTASGLTLVLASNPIFPEFVHQKRMAWVGIAPTDPWTLITHIGNMSYVKPRSGYFLEISRMIAIPPQQCLMVGNDALNDMAAGRVGMHTFLTTDVEALDYGSLQMTVAREDPPPLTPPDFSGRFKELPRIVTQLSNGSKAT